jgi:hypothetical protein
VPTSSSYYITQRNFDMRKSLNFTPHVNRRDLGKLGASVPKSGASAVPPLSRARKHIENTNSFEGRGYRFAVAIALTFAILLRFSSVLASAACKIASFSAASCNMAESVIA